LVRPEIGSAVGFCAGFTLPLNAYRYGYGLLSGGLGMANSAKFCTATIGVVLHFRAILFNLKLYKLLTCTL
jgi:hypothetical protein